MAQVLSFASSFVLAIGYFLYRDGIDAKLSSLYYERHWKILEFLVDTTAYNEFKIIYLSTFVGVIAASIVIGIIRASGASLAVFAYSAAGLVLGSFIFWWFHPDRISPRFGGGVFFLFDTLIGLGLIAAGFSVVLLVYWMTPKIFHS